MCDRDRDRDTAVNGVVSGERVCKCWPAMDTEVWDRDTCLHFCEEVRG